MRKPAEKKVTFKRDGSIWIASCTGSPEVKIYESVSRGKPLFTVVHYLAGIRKRDVRTSLDTAKAHAETIARALAAGDAAVAPISAKERVVFQRARATLAGLDLPVDLAVDRLADALKRLGGVPLDRAVDYFITHNPAGVSSKTVAEVVAEFLAAKKADRRGHRHLKDLENRLGTFSKAFQCAISSVTTASISEWLRGLKCSGRTRNNYRNAARNLFRYAAGQGIVPPNQINWDGSNGVALAKEEDTEIEIYTPAEIEKLIAAARWEGADLKTINPRYFRKTPMLPFLVLGAFAGLRTAEIQGQVWEDINDNYIRVTVAKGNTPQRRLVPISDNLKAWLATCRKESGPVCELNNLTTAIQRLADRAGVAWKHNALRHSYISYRVAEIGDIPRVALEAGNSPTMINAHYRELVTPEDAATWFGIRP